MRFGVVHHSLGHSVGPEEAMKRVASYGGLAYATGLSRETKDIYGPLASHYGLELITHFSAPFIAKGAKLETRDFERFCSAVCEPLGVKVVTVCSSHHRWRQDPPLTTQLERLSGALAKLCPVAADHGVKIALENHADYRADEILEVLSRVDHPALGVNFDSANPFCVIEEPVEAARKLAPYTLTTHIKDMKLYPPTDPEMPAILGGSWSSTMALIGTAIGEGDVDVATVVEILAAHVSSETTFLLETEAPGDRLAATDRSVAFVKTHFSDKLTFRKPV